MVLFQMDIRKQDVDLCLLLCRKIKLVVEESLWSKLSLVWNLAIPFRFCGGQTHGIWNANTKLFKIFNHLFISGSRMVVQSYMYKYQRLFSWRKLRVPGNFWIDRCFLGCKELTELMF